MAENMEIVEVAQAAMRAAMKRAEELGLKPLEWILGVEHAYESAMRGLMLIRGLGVETACELGEALAKADAYDTLKEAEEIMKGESE